MEAIYAHWLTAQGCRHPKTRRAWRLDCTVYGACPHWHQHRTETAATRCANDRGCDPWICSDTVTRRRLGIGPEQPIPSGEFDKAPHKLMCLHLSN